MINLNKCASLRGQSIQHLLGLLVDLPDNIKSLLNLLASLVDLFHRNLSFLLGNVLVQNLQQHAIMVAFLLYLCSSFNKFFILLL
jgi:hypothetical protein